MGGAHPINLVEPKKLSRVVARNGQPAAPYQSLRLREKLAGPPPQVSGQQSGTVFCGLSDYFEVSTPKILERMKLEMKWKSESRMVIICLVPNGSFGKKPAL